MVFNSDTMGFHGDLIEFGVQHPCWLMIVGDIHYPSIKWFIKWLLPAIVPLHVHPVVIWGWVKLAMNLLTIYWGTG